MAIAHDYSSESHTDQGSASVNVASFNWVHSGRASASGGVQGAVVFTYTNTSTIYVTGVTYGGVPLAAVTSATAVDSATEPAVCRAWFTGSGLAGGNQTVEVLRTNNTSVIWATCATMVASTFTRDVGAPVLLQNDGTLAAQAIDTLGRYAIRYAGVVSGLATPPAADTGSTQDGANDYTSRSASFVRETTPGAGSRTVGFSAGSDDRAAVHVAFTEIDADISSTDLVFVAEARANDRASQQKELLFVDDLGGFRRIHDLIYLPNLLWLVDAPTIEGPATGPTLRQEIDGLFLRITRTSERTLLTPESVLLGTSRSSERTYQALSLLPVNDVVLAGVIRGFVVLDSALLYDQTVKSTDVARRDLLLLAVQRYGDLVKVVAEAVLLLDSVAAIVERFGITRSATDGLFIVSRPFNLRHDLRYPDSVFLQDTVAMLVEGAAILRSALDRLFIRDLPLSADHDLWADLDAVLLLDTVTTLISAAANVRSALDNLFLLDAVRRDHLLVQVDGLFTADTRISETARYFADSLLTADRRLSLVERRVVEGVLLADSVLRALERLQRDGVLLGDSAEALKMGEIIRYALDALLLYDAVRKSPEFVAQRDGLLLTDARFSELARALLDSLLVAETRTSALIRSHLDTLYVYDTLATEKLAGLLREVTDGLLLKDGVVRLMAQQQRDTTLLSDAALLGKDIAREVAEAMFVLDQRASSGREINQLEGVALHVLANYVREMLIDEGLYAEDTAAAQWFPVIVEVLTYVRLATHDILGTRMLTVDLLGRRCSWTRWRLD